MDNEVSAAYAAVEQFERTEQLELGIVRPVGEESLAVITRLNPTEENLEYVGNILRRTCVAAGEASCVAVCVLREADPEEYRRNEARRCADRNLAQGLESYGIRPEDVLMVAVTGDEVGFGDKLAEYRDAGKLKGNPEGWAELPGFNAFFARASEVPAIGSRLADCAHFEFEFKDSEGNTVIGFEHGTRPNMRGEGKFGSECIVNGKPGFDADGRPASYTEHVLAAALAHYGADPESVRIRLSSSIKPTNFVKHFDNREKMEEHIPGWYDAGFVTNVTNPDWQPGDPITPTDEWHADARGMILHDVRQTMVNLGIPAENLVHDSMLDPADSDGEFSSYENRDRYGDLRDLYMVAHKTAIRQ